MININGDKEPFKLSSLVKNVKVIWELGKVLGFENLENAFSFVIKWHHNHILN